MKYQQASERVAGYRQEISELRAKMRKALDAAEPQVVEDYVFSSSEGPRRLSELFGGKTELIAIHNMGRKCTNCTMWADGFNGVYDHLADRAAFVVTSPDSPKVQQEFAASRGWRFPMVSHEGTSFAADMGYRNEKGGYLPGISVFRRDGKRIVRVSDAGFEPHDDYCAVWHVLDLLPGGVGDWEPKFKYS
jgi:predicted dithiol-disulfide oxidoreductase (DUF899 family)